MADIFLEKRQESYREQAAKGVTKKANSVLRLAEKGAAISFDSSYKVRIDQLEKIVEAARAVDSHAVQCLIVPNCVVGVRNMPLAQCPAKILLGILGATDAECFITVGRALQMMQLQAAEIGLSVSYTNKFDAANLEDAFSLHFKPVVLLAVGRAAR